MWSFRSRRLLIFPKECSIVLIPFVEKTIISLLKCYCTFCQKSVSCTCLTSLSVLLIYVIYDLSTALPILLLLYSKIFYSSSVIPIILSFFKTDLALLVFLSFHINYRISLSKKSYWILIGMTLNLQGDGEPQYLCWCCFPNSTVSCLLIQSSLISFMNILELLAYGL